MPDDMTTADKLRGLMKGATKGPLSVKYEFNVFAGERLFASCGGHSSNRNGEKVHEENLANTRLTVAAVNLYPELAAVAEAASGIDPRCECESLRGHESDDVVCDSCKLKSALSALDAAVAREVG